MLYQKNFKEKTMLKSNVLQKQKQKNRNKAHGKHCFTENNGTTNHRKKATLCRKQNRKKRRHRNTQKIENKKKQHFCSKFLIHKKNIEKENLMQNTQTQMVWKIRNNTWKPLWKTIKFKTNVKLFAKWDKNYFFKYETAESP